MPVRTTQAGRCLRGAARALLWLLNDVGTARMLLPATSVYALATVLVTPAIIALRLTQQRWGIALLGLLAWPLMVLAAGVAQQQALELENRARGRTCSSSNRNLYS